MDSPRKKILLVVTKSNWGGAQAYVHTLATHFKTEGNDVVVAYGGTGERGAQTGLLAEKLQTSGIRTIFVPAFTRDVHAWNEISLLSQLRKIIRDERPDILHLNSSKAGGVGALAGRLEKTPNIIFTSHGLAYDEARSFFAKGLIWISTWLTILLSHITIVISNDTYTRARALPFCKKKIHLIYNGINPLALWPRKEARERLVERNAEKGVWIGTIAELTPNKDLSTLLSAAVNLRDRGHSFTLVIIGEGEERSMLTRLIKDSNLTDRVYLAGFIPDAANLLCAFDIFALTSTKEGLPYVLLEAGEAKCAVVATRIPGTTDIIDKNTGLLVSPRSVRETTDALDALITDEEKRHMLGDALHLQVREKFSKSKMLEEIGMVYR